jgi:hypothetical protein
MAALRRRVFDVANDFNARGAFFSDLAAAEVERMVIMKFLMCHRHSYTDFLLREPLPAGSSAVTKVEGFIAANWDKPLDIGDGDVGGSQCPKSVQAIQEGPGLYAGGVCETHPAHSRAGDARAERGRWLGGADCAPVRLSESRSFRARFSSRVRRIAL